MAHYGDNEYKAEYTRGARARCRALCLGYVRSFGIQYDKGVRRLNGVETAINSIVAFIESFWSWFDSTAIVGQITFLDFAFGSFVVSLSLWLVFGFLGGDDN